MNLKLFTAFLLLCIVWWGEASYAQLDENHFRKVAYQVPSAYPLSFAEKNMLKGYLGERYTRNLEARLLKIDEEGILEGFYNRPGKQRWVGEHVGKYLEAAANTWIITKDSRLKTQMDRIFTRLLETQKEDGYLGTYLPENYWTAWDVWVHKYDIYGILAYYKAVGDKKALDAAIKIGDLLCKNFGEGPGQKNIIKAGSHVGMAATSVIDPMLDLYIYTNDTKYLNFCNYVIKAYNSEGGPAIVTTLLKTGRVDKVANAKAYEMLSNILGLVKMYRLTKNADLLKVVNSTYDDITANRLFVTGTASDHERFMDNQYLKADTAAHMGEGCVTTTWLQFNLQLFSITGDLKYYNEIEKTVYNHLLGAENPQTGCVSYYTPLIGEKPYRCHITCCMSSVPRGIALVPFINYGKLNNVPTLLLYETAKIRDVVQAAGKSVNLELDVKSQFPAKGTAAIALKISAPAQFPLQFRAPVWADKFTVKVNGKAYASAADKLLKIERTWKSTDKIEVTFNIPTTVLDGGTSYPGYFAFKRGPQVLAVDYALNRDLSLDNLNYPQVGTLKEEQSSQLPKGWIGGQLFTANLKTEQGRTLPVKLVPYAEASQTGGLITVWIPSSQSIH
ncbi:MAG: glycoside hydrolase family 127 protein [Niabella sp.]